MFSSNVLHVNYLMTAMLIMGKYFPYLTACAVSRAVMEVEKIISHLPGGKESIARQICHCMGVTL